MAKSCVLEPASETKLCWDILGIPILAWDLITIPLQVFDMGSLGDQIMDGAGWVTMIYWSLDMPVTFFTAIFDKQGGVVTDHKAIAKNYFHGNFFMDLIIILGDWLPSLLVKDARDLF